MQLHRSPLPRAMSTVRSDTRPARRRVPPCQAGTVAARTVTDRPPPGLRGRSAAVGRRSTRPDEPAVAAPRAPADGAADLSAEASADPSAGPSCDPCSHPAPMRSGPAPEATARTTTCAPPRGSSAGGCGPCAAPTGSPSCSDAPGGRCSSTATPAGRVRHVPARTVGAPRPAVRRARAPAVMLARREGAAAAPGRAVRLVLHGRAVAARRGAPRPRRRPGAARAAGLPRRRLRRGPPHRRRAWAVFAAPAETDLSPWPVGRRDLLTDLGPG